MSNNKIAIWVLRFMYAGFTAYFFVQPKASNIDLVKYGCLTVFSFIAAYLVGYLYTIGTDDGRKFLNNKKKKDEIINH
jgi:hypothetical protein